MGVGYFITGTDNILVTFARETVCCCATHVAGWLTRGGGVKAWLSHSVNRGNIRLSSCGESSLVVYCVRCNHRDGVLPVPTTAAVLAALDVKSVFIHVVVGRWTRSEGTGAGSLRALLDSWAGTIICRRGELRHLRVLLVSCLCVGGL